jgi:hypothetical protein
MGVGVEKRIEIAAPAERIWALLADVQAWSNWNPLYASATGKLAVGETIHMRVAIPGMKPQSARPVVTEVTPNRRIRYFTRAMAGLTTGDRYIEVVELQPGRCLVINGELMGGPIGTLAGRLLGGRVGQGFAAMNAALKERAEASSS